MKEGINKEDLRFLYEENAKIVAIFWDWRNKIITYFFTAVGALFALSAWLYQQRFGGWSSAPFFLGALLSYFAIRLDGRNGTILVQCYKAGRNIENALDVGDEIKDVAIFKFLGAAHEKNEITYTTIVRRTYFVVAGLLLVIAVLIIWFQPYPLVESK